MFWHHLSSSSITPCCQYITPTSLISLFLLNALLSNITALFILAWGKDGGVLQLISYTLSSPPRDMAGITALGRFLSAQTAPTLVLSGFSLPLGILGGLCPVSFRFLLYRFMEETKDSLDNTINQLSPSSTSSASERLVVCCVLQACTLCLSVYKSWKCFATHVRGNVPEDVWMMRGGIFWIPVLRTGIQFLESTFLLLVGVKSIRLDLWSNLFSDCNFRKSNNYSDDVKRLFYV